MTIGKDWRERRKTKQAADARTTKEQEAADQRREADLAIAQIPGLIEQALAKGEDSIHVLPRHLNFKDVACRDVDKLVDRLGGTVSPTAGDLAGVALLIFEWCRDNDLECFIGFGGKVPLNGPEWDLCARPAK